MRSTAFAPFESNLKTTKTASAKRHLGENIAPAQIQADRSGAAGRRVQNAAKYRKSEDNREKNRQELAVRNI